MKFTLDVALPERILADRGDDVDDEFTRALLAIDGVASVFGVNDFVTITRDTDAEWDPIIDATCRVVEEHLSGGDAPDPDAVARARNLLRNAVAPPPPTPVDLGRSRSSGDD